jgi:uncharacterized protein YaaN involved in tellurite resistance
MAKTIRRSVAPAMQRTIKTSVVIDAHLHSRLSALASLRGCTTNALLVEAAEMIAKNITVIDRRKPEDHGESGGLVKGSAPDAA